MSPQQVNLGDPPTRTQDPGFIPSPTANNPNARQRANSTDSGFIPSPTENGYKEPTEPQPEDGFFSRAWKRLNTPPAFIQKNLLDPAKRETERVQAETNKQIAEGHPVRAFIAEGEAGVDSDIDKIASGFMTPISLGLSALSFAEGLPWVVKAAETSKALKAGVMGAKATQMTAGTVFGTQSAITLLTPKQPGETNADYLERELMAGSQLGLSSAGNLATFKDGVHLFLRHRLGMSDDLAGQVSDKVTKINEARATQAKSIESAKTELSAKQRAIDSKRAQQTVAVEQELEHNLNQLEGQSQGRISGIERSIDEQTQALQDKLGKLQTEKVQMGKAVVTDTAHTLAQYEAQFNTRFEEIGQKVPGAITDADAVRDIISEEAQNHGVQPKEIPSSATAALPKVEPITIMGRPASPEEIARFKSEGLTFSQGELEFDQLTRVKNDLYNAAYSNRDGAVRSALYRSAERISDIQEVAAARSGQGEAYAKLKGDYLRFIRGIGSQDVRDWLSAETMREQEMSGKISQLIKPSTAPAFHEILSSVGIDTKGFDDVMADIRAGRQRLKVLPKERARLLKEAQEGVPETAAREKSVAKGEMSRISIEAKEATKEARGEAAQAIKEARAIGKSGVAEAEAPGKIVPGRKTSELVGKTNEELLRDRMNATAARLKGHGMARPFRMFGIVYGLFRMVEGLTSGQHFALASGAALVAADVAPEFVPNLVRNRSFQDWVIRESGVEPTNKLLIARMRKGISGLYPFLRRAAQSQAPSSTLSSSQPPTRQDNP